MFRLPTYSVHLKQQRQRQQKRLYRYSYIIRFHNARQYFSFFYLTSLIWIHRIYPIRVLIGSPFICFDVLFPDFKFTTWWWCCRWMPDVFKSSPMKVSVALVVVVNITPPSGMIIWPSPELSGLLFKAFLLPTNVSFSTNDGGVSFLTSSS